MDTRATRRGIPAGALWGALGVLAWAAFTVILGGGSAHASESDDRPADPVTSLIGGTLSTVTDAVTPVVTQIVAPVVQTAVAPVQQAAPAVAAPVVEAVRQTPVVGQATAPVVQAVGDTAPAAVSPVTDLLGDRPTTQLTKPVVDAIAGLPAIGALLGDLGAVRLVDTLTGVVDDAAALIGTTTTETVTPVVGSLHPADAGPAPATDAGASDIAVLPAVHARAGTSGASPSLDGMPASSIRTVDAALRDALVAAALHGHSPAGMPPALPAVPASSSSSTGSGGAPSSACARIDGAGFLPLPSWSRASGASDDDLPSSAVADTDVSPD